MYLTVRPQSRLGALDLDDWEALRVPCFQWVRVQVLWQGLPEGAAVGEEEGHRIEKLHAQCLWGCPIGPSADEADGICP